MRVHIIIFFFTLHIYTQSNPPMSYYFGDETTYNEKVPTPESIIGYNIGQWHLSHDKIVKYLQILSESSNRIKFESRGETFEGRPLILLIITSEKNHEKLNTIKKEHIDAVKQLNKKKYADRPVVIYSGSSIHGNESSGANAAVLIAYHLAASKSTRINKLLENSVILLDPCMNPDGLQRFANWVNRNKSFTTNTDSNDIEFNENWPGARTNHYWFDLNRDWLPAQLPESKVRLKTFHEWLPNILTDHHEMGTNSTFFFQPGVPSRTHPLTPKKNQELTEEIGKFHIRALNKLGSFYYSQEDYDDFYYGKGSTYPDINGSIGILFEQASSRGHAQESDNGILTFPFTIRNQLTASLSTFYAASEMREKILDYQIDFFINAKKERSSKSNECYIFGDNNDSSKSFHLAELLNHHKIEIFKLKEDTKINGLEFHKETSYIIPKNQKQNRLLTALFEKRTEFKDSLFYDVSSWSLDLAFNVKFYDKASSKLIGEKIKLRLPSGELVNESNYAYVMPWSDYYSPKVLYDLMQRKIRVKVALQPFSVNENNFDYGSILIPLQNQNYSTNEITNILSELAKNNNLKIYGLSTGEAEGPDLGSRKFKTLSKPRIALLVGKGIDVYDAGEIWHLMDSRYGIPITKIDISNFNKLNLNRYNCIILPNSSGLDEGIASKLKKWVIDGGNLISYQNSVKWLNKNMMFPADFVKNEINKNKISFEDRSKSNGAQIIGGAIFEVNIDRSHPINFGYKDNKISIFRNTRIFMKPSEISYENPLLYTKNPLLSGYISEENLQNLKGTVPFKSHSLGSGKIVGFTDNTNFRAFWYGTNKLLCNSLFFRNEF